MSVTTEVHPKTSTSIAQRELVASLLKGFKDDGFPRVKVEGEIPPGSPLELYATYARALNTIGFVSYQLAQPEVRRKFPNYYSEFNLRPMQSLLDGLGSLASISALHLQPEDTKNTLNRVVPDLLAEAHARLALREPRDFFTDASIRYAESEDEAGEVTRGIQGVNDENTLASLGIDFNLRRVSEDIEFLQSLTPEMYQSADVEGKAAIATRLQNLVRASVERRMSAVQHYYSESDHVLPVTWDQFRNFTQTNMARRVSYAGDGVEVHDVLGSIGHIAHELKNPFSATLLNMQMLARMLQRGTGTPERQAQLSDTIFKKWRDIYLVTRLAALDLKEGNAPVELSVNDFIRLIAVNLEELREQPRESAKPIFPQILGSSDRKMDDAIVRCSALDILSFVRGVVSNTSKVAATKEHISGINIAAIPEIIDGNLHVRVVDNLGGFPPELGIAMNEAVPIPNPKDPGARLAKLGTGFAQGRNGYGHNTESDMLLPSTGDGMAAIRSALETKFHGDLRAWNIDENANSLPPNVATRDGNTYYVQREQPVFGACYEMILPLVSQ